MRCSLTTIAIVLILTACTSPTQVQSTDQSMPKDPSVSSATPTPNAHWNLVALGDSTARANATYG